MRGDARVPMPLAGKCQTVTAGNRTTNPVGQQTWKVLIQSEDGGHYRYGDNTVSASTTDTRIGAGNEHLVRIPGGSHVAFAGSGTFYVSEMGE